MIALPALAKLASRAPEPPAQRCELCGLEIPDQHRHVLELDDRAVRCACYSCALLFTRDDVTAPIRTIPDRVLADPAIALSSTRWAELGIPVGLAFFYRDSRRSRVVACYPGPAGLVEGQLDDAVWGAVADATPLAGQLAADVEALLVRGERGNERLASYLVPISTAYELAGRLRAKWQGFTGGDDARAELVAFFAELDRKGRRGSR